MKSIKWRFLSRRRRRCVNSPTGDFKIQRGDGNENVA